MVFAPVAVMVPLAGMFRPLEASANHLMCPPGNIVPVGNPLIVLVNIIAKLPVGLYSLKYRSEVGVMVSFSVVCVFAIPTAVPLAVIVPSMTWLAYPLDKELAVENVSSICAEEFSVLDPLVDL